MSLAPKSPVKERILATGGPGSGKTSAWLSIAKKNPDSHFYVIDSDFAVDRMLDGKSLTNVTHDVATEWTEFVELTRKYQKAMKPNDWLVIDFISPAWNAVQAWYVEQVFGKDIDAYFVDRRKAKAKNDLEGDTDWKVINKAYGAWATMLLKTPGHLFATAPVKAVGDRDDAATKQLYALHGVKPEGQKMLSHQFHTVLMLSRARGGEFQMSTVKDRERREVNKAEVKDFALSYLLSVAGWRPVAS